MTVGTVPQTTPLRDGYRRLLEPPRFAPLAVPPPVCAVLSEVVADLR